MKHRQKRLRRGTRIYRDAGHHAGVLYLLQHAVDMFRGLKMDRQQSRSRGEKHIKEILRRLDHDMHVKKRLRIPFAQRADERRSIREVRDKVPVHDIHMEPIGFALKLSDVTLHIEDISGQQRGGDDDLPAIFQLF